MTPILWTFRRCPYAMRARMALHLADITYDHREVALRNKPDAMLDVSPKGTVPVLVLPDGRVLEESLEIIRWALPGADIGTAFTDIIDGRSSIIWIGINISPAMTRRLNAAMWT